MTKKNSCRVVRIRENVLVIICCFEERADCSPIELRSGTETDRENRRYNNTGDAAAVLVRAGMPLE